ncbi:MAG: hypothetical protein KDD84_19720 [Caldilineaceae bacterium]|nr:hypothetical protein [Caldilineaceae bacterium]
MSLLGPDIPDWIDGFVGRLLHGPMHRFSFSRHSGFTGSDVEHLLRRYGVRVWQREMDDPDELALHVKQSQAVWAEYVLCRAGVPLTCELLEPRNAEHAAQHDSMPTPWSEKGVGAHTVIDHVVDWLDRFTGSSRR